MTTRILIALFSVLLLRNCAFAQPVAGNQCRITDGVRTATIRDTGSSDALNVAVVDASGNQITSFSGGGGGSGTQYTEGDTDSTITGTVVMWEDTSDTLRAVSATKPLPIDITDSSLPVTDNGGSLTVDGTVAATQSGTWNVTNISGTVSLPTGAATSANQTTVIGHVDGIETLLGTSNTNTGNVVTSVQLLDDAVATTASAITSKGIAISGTDGTNARVLKTDTSGELQVDVLSMAAGTNNIGDVDVATFEASSDVTLQSAATATGNGTTLSVVGYGTAVIQITGTFTATVTFEGTVDGTNYQALSATQIGTTTIATTATTAGIYRLSVAGLSTIRARISSYSSGSVTAVGRATNAPFGPKVMSISGTVAATQSGTWTVQPGNTANTTPWLVSPRPATNGGLDVYHLVSAASTNASVVKASAGQVCGWKIRNRSAGDRKLVFHNASSTPTAGASVYFALDIPAGSAANAFSEHCIAFSSGIAITTVSGMADSDTTAVSANDLNINLFYK